MKRKIQYTSKNHMIVEEDKIYNRMTKQRKRYEYIKTKICCSRCARPIWKNITTSSRLNEFFWCNYCDTYYEKEQRMIDGHYLPIWRIWKWNSVTDGNWCDFALGDFLPFEEEKVSFT